MVSLLSPKKLGFLIIALILLIIPLTTLSLQKGTSTKSSAAVDTSVPQVYWGAYIDGGQYGVTSPPWNWSAVDTFESHAGKKISILHFGWSWKSSNGSYNNFASNVFDTVRQHGVIPYVDWGSMQLGGGGTQPNFTNNAIASGKHDAYIKSFATAAKNWGHPMMIRLDWEMNGWWQFPWTEGTSNGSNPNNNPPGSFVAMWKHVHDIFTSVGANNVTWVWCPNIVSNDTSTLKLAPLTQVYPGNSYIDWSCLDGYNKYSSWYSFKQLMMGKDAGVSFLHNSYSDVVNLTGGKPIMIGETGSQEANDGGYKKAQWFKDALLTDIPNSFPRIKAFVYFNWNDNNSANKWPIESTTTAQNGYAVGIALPYYASNNYGNLPNGKIQELATISLQAADTTAPSVSITSPVTGTSVSGPVTLNAKATDNIAVSHVDYFVGSTRIGSTIAPYSLVWDSTSVADGQYTLLAKAYDAANNVGTSTSVTVTVKNIVADSQAPSVSLLLPTNGQSVSGTVTISGSASDNVGVAKVQFFVDGNWLSTSLVAPYNYSWNSKSVTNGQHQIVLKAFDSANNIGTSNRINVNVANSVPLSLTLAPVADAWTWSTYPTSNHGPDGRLHANGSPKEVIYMKFDLSKFVTVDRAELSFFIYRLSNNNVVIKSVADSSWAEQTLNFNNEPALGAVVAGLSPVATGVYQVDVSNYLSQNAGKVVSLAISTDDNNNSSFDIYSREFTDPIGSAPTLTVTGSTLP